MAHITIKDRPCGWGKSTEIHANYKPGEKYVTVLPFLSEVDRTIARAGSQSRFEIKAPSDENGSKRDDVKRLLEQGVSIACTHQLFYRLGTLATQVVREDIQVPEGFVGITSRNICLMDDYHLIVDEVVDPFDTATGPGAHEFRQTYVEKGMATIEEDGQVLPTSEWEEHIRHGFKTFSPTLYEQAKSGALYMFDDRLFVITIPMELLLRPKTTTIYTYRAEGTILLAFLRKLKAKVAGTEKDFTLEVDKLDARQEAEFRADVKAALSVKSIPSLEKFTWSHGAQTKLFSGAGGRAAAKSAGNALKKWAGTELRCVDKRRVMLTCARQNWYDNKPGEKPVAGRVAKQSRLFGHPSCVETDKGLSWETTGVRWVGNTTRGVNDFVECTHAVYLYDQHPQPDILRFLGLSKNSREGRVFSDAYALSELIQWLFRCCIRCGGVNGTGNEFRPRYRATVYIPSARMRNLLINWLETGEVNSNTPNQAILAAA